LNEQINKIKKLFLVFLRIGAFTFGGGYAMIPLIHAEIVENKKWITDEEMVDMFAIAESTPGVIAVNTATFVGYKIAGFWGSFFATLGVVLPSFFIIILISLFYQQFSSLKIMGYIFSGIRAGVVILIISAAAKLFKVCKKDAFNFIIIIAVFLLSAFLDINAVYLLLGALIIGIVYNIYINKGEMQK